MVGECIFLLEAMITNHIHSSKQRKDGLQRNPSKSGDNKFGKKMISTKDVINHESASLSRDNNDPDMPISQCRMGQKAPNFKVQFTIQSIFLCVLHRL